MKMRMKEEARFNEYDMVIFDVVLRDVHEGLPIDAVDYRNYVSVHRMVMENRPVDPGSIQGSHRPISFIRIKDRTRANDNFV